MYNRAQPSVHLTGGMPSANALWLGDARWKLVRPICGIFGLYLHPSTPLRGSPALGVLSTPAHPQVTQTVGCFEYKEKEP